MKIQNKYKIHSASFIAYPVKNQYNNNSVSKNQSFLANGLIFNKSW